MQDAPTHAGAPHTTCQAGTAIWHCTHLVRNICKTNIRLVYNTWRCCLACNNSGVGSKLVVECERACICMMYWQIYLLLHVATLQSILAYMLASSAACMSVSADVQSETSLLLGGL